MMIMSSRKASGYVINDFEQPTSVGVEFEYMFENQLCVAQHVQWYSCDTVYIPSKHACVYMCTNRTTDGLANSINNLEETCVYM